MNNLYDFINLSDVDAELAARVSNEGTTEKVKAYADIVNGAPRALSIAQIEVVATRMIANGDFAGGDSVPTSTTVRSYLNKAIEAGMIGKASRQFYCKLEDAVEGVEVEDDTSDAEAAEAEVDAAADLGLV